MFTTILLEPGIQLSIAFFLIVFSLSNIESIDAALSPSEKKTNRAGKFFWYYLTTTSTSTATSVSITTTITGKTNQDIKIFMKQHFRIRMSLHSLVSLGFILNIF